MKSAELNGKPKRYFHSLRIIDCPLLSFPFCEQPICPISSFEIINSRVLNKSGYTIYDEQNPNEIVTETVLYKNSIVEGRFEMCQTKHFIIENPRFKCPERYRMINTMPLGDISKKIEFRNITNGSEVTLSPKSHRMHHPNPPYESPGLEEIVFTNCSDMIVHGNLNGYQVKQEQCKGMRFEGYPN